MYISPRKYTIIRRAMSKRLVEGGLARVAGQSCLAGPSVLRLHPGFGYRRAWKYGREPCAESQVFLCIATHFLEYPRAASFVVTFIPPSSFLVSSPHGPPLTATA